MQGQLCRGRQRNNRRNFADGSNAAAEVPAAGGSQTIPRIVGRGYALEMLLSGRWITAAEAKKIKMVNRVVARTELLPTVEKLADTIRQYDRTALSNAKQAIVEGLDLPLPQGLELEARLAGLRQY